MIKLNDKINKRHHVVIAQNHSFDRFINHLKSKGTYIVKGTDNNQYYHCNGYICYYSIDGNQETSISCDVRKLPYNVLNILLTLS